MIRTWEPFQSRINLHIKTEFLQELWERYVPVSSEAYERISLIYLNRGLDAAQGQKDRIQLLIRLIVKNMRVQINLSQNSMILNQDTLRKRFAGASNFYLNQLRTMDFHTYQILCRAMASVEQTVRENRRYQQWSREHRNVLKLQRDYENLHTFSGILKEWLEGPARELENAFGQELFSSLGKREYELLSEALIWTEKHSAKEFIRRCSGERYQEILRRLEQETELHERLKEYSSPETAGKLKEYSSPETAGRLKEISSPETAGRLREGRRTGLPETGDQERSAKQLEEKARTEDTKHTFDNEREAFLSLVEKLDQREFRDFYQKVLFIDKSGRMEASGISYFQTGLIWKRKKREVKRQLRDFKAEEMSVFLERFPLLLSEACRIEEALEQEAITEEQGDRNRIRAEVCKKYKKRVKKIQEKYTVQIQRSLEQEVLKPDRAGSCTELPEVTQAFQNEYFYEEETREQEPEVQRPIPMGEEQRGHGSQRAMGDFVWTKPWQLLGDIRKKLQSRKQEIIFLERKALEGYREILPIQDIFLERKALEGYGEILPIRELSLEESWQEVAEERRFMTDFSKLDRTLVRKMQRWSLELLENVTGNSHLSVPEKESGQDAASRQGTLPEESGQEEAELRLFLAQVSAFRKPEEAFVYRKSLLRNPSVQELLWHVRELDAAERRKFAAQMADMLLVCRKLPQELLEQSLPDSFGRPVSEAFPKPEEKRPDEMEIWGHALLAYSMETGREKEEDYFSDALEQEASKERRMESDIPKMLSEAETVSNSFSPEQIRRQIEASRQQSGLRQLLDQVNHQIQGTGVSLVFRESQLQNTSIRNMLEKLAGAKEEEYKEIVRQLSEVVVRQFQIKTNAQREAENRRAELPASKEVPEREGVPFIPENGQKREYAGSDKDREQPSLVWKEKHQLQERQKRETLFFPKIEGEKLFEAYPKLVSYILEYEKQRRLSAEGTLPTAGARGGQLEAEVRNSLLWMENKGRVQAELSGKTEERQMNPAFGISAQAWGGDMAFWPDVQSGISGRIPEDVQPLQPDLASGDFGRILEDVRPLQPDLASGDFGRILEDVQPLQPDSASGDFGRILDVQPLQPDLASEGIGPATDSSRVPQLKTELMFPINQQTSPADWKQQNAPAEWKPQNPPAEWKPQNAPAEWKQQNSPVDWKWQNAPAEWKPQNAPADRKRQASPSGLEYALPENHTGDEERREQARRQAKEAEDKALMQQLEVRLKEVEHKLAETEGQGRAKESIQDITEKVKRQFHEELHIERLRRGLL